jgi:hypothetical protein
VDPYAGNRREPQSLHKYLYCHGDPVNNIDPSGQFIGLLISGALRAGGYLTDAGAASMAVGLVGFVASLAAYYAAGLGVLVGRQMGNIEFMADCMYLQGQAEEAMVVSAYFMAGGALAYTAGTVMVGFAAALQTARAAGSNVTFDWSRARHIFRPDIGHVNPATMASKQRFAALFEEVASNSANLRTDAVQANIITQQAANAGVRAYTWTSRSGEQIWVAVRNGLVENAGVNLPGATR